MTNVKLSIVIPVYNTARHIEQCLVSIGRHDHLEVICVDDGSTDGSGDILDRLSSRFDLKVIHQENAGVSCARNRGIAEARGEWITFCDSDDAYVCGSVEWLLNFLATINADMVVYGHVSVRDIYSETILREPNVVIYDMGQREDALEALKSVYPLAWNTAYHHEFVRNCRFTSGIHAGEDSLFGLERLLDANTIIVLDLPLYYYVQRENSCTHLISEERIKGCVDASVLTQIVGRKWKWYDVSKAVFFRKVRLASIGEAVGLIHSIGVAKREALWNYFFDRLTPVFCDGYVPYHVRWLYNLAFKWRSPFMIYWLLHKPYVIFKKILKLNILMLLWRRIR